MPLLRGEGSVIIGKGSSRFFEKGETARATHGGGLNAGEGQSKLHIGGRRNPRDSGKKYRQIGSTRGGWRSVGKKGKALGQGGGGKIIRASHACGRYKSFTSNRHPSGEGMRKRKSGKGVSVRGGLRRNKEIFAHISEGRVDFFLKGKIIRKKNKKGGEKEESLREAPHQKSIVSLGKKGTGDEGNYPLHRKKGENHLGLTGGPGKNR